MRMTKKNVRAAKSAVQKRINEIRQMDRPALEAEWKRMYPNMNVLEGTDVDLAGSMIYDAVDRALPDFWLA